MSEAIRTAQLLAQAPGVASVRVERRADPYRGVEHEVVVVTTRAVTPDDLTAYVQTFLATPAPVEVASTPRTASSAPADRVRAAAPLPFALVSPWSALGKRPRGRRGARAWNARPPRI